MDENPRSLERFTEECLAQYDGTVESLVNRRKELIASAEELFEKLTDEALTTTRGVDRANFSEADWDNADLFVSDFTAVAKLVQDKADLAMRAMPERVRLLRDELHGFLVTKFASNDEFDSASRALRATFKEKLIDPARDVPPEAYDIYTAPQIALNAVVESYQSKAGAPRLKQGLEEIKSFLPRVFKDWGDEAKTILQKIPSVYLGDIEDLVETAIAEKQKQF